MNQLSAFIDSTSVGAYPVSLSPCLPVSAPYAPPDSLFCTDPGPFTV